MRGLCHRRSFQFLRGVWGAACTCCYLNRTSSKQDRAENPSEVSMLWVASHVCISRAQFTRSGKSSLPTAQQELLMSRCLSQWVGLMFHAKSPLLEGPYIAQIHAHHHRFSQVPVPLFPWAPVASLTLQQEPPVPQFSASEMCPLPLRDFPVFLPARVCRTSLFCLVPHFTNPHRPPLWFHTHHLPHCHLKAPTCHRGWQVLSRCCTFHTRMYQMLPVPRHMLSTQIHDLISGGE